MPYSVRKVDVFHDEEAADDIRFLDRLCFSAGDAPIEFSEDSHWWIAYHGKDPVAYAGIRGSRTMASWGYLCRCGVDPNHRGHGLQVRLLKQRIKFARGRGWLGLLTDTSYDNIKSANNLIDAGFKMFYPKHPWSFSNANYWKLELGG